MTERERRFIECYMGEAAGNATKAARLAGYSPATARKQASRLLTKGHIRAAIDERQHTDPTVWSREQRQSFWTRIAADNSIAVRDRLKASELLARSQGDFIEKRLLQLEGDGRLTLAQLIAGTTVPHSRYETASRDWSETAALPRSKEGARQGPPPDLVPPAQELQAEEEPTVATRPEVAARDESPVRWVRARDTATGTDRTVSDWDPFR